MDRNLGQFTKRIYSGKCAREVILCVVGCRVNVNDSHRETPVREAKVKYTDTTRGAGEDVECREPVLSEAVADAAALGSGLEESYRVQPSLLQFFRW